MAQTADLRPVIENGHLVYSAQAPRSIDPWAFRIGTLLVLALFAALVALWNHT